MIPVRCFDMDVAAYKHILCTHTQIAERQRQVTLILSLLLSSSSSSYCHLLLVVTVIFYWCLQSSSISSHWRATITLLYHLPLRLFSRAHLHVMGMLRFMSEINQQSLPTSFYYVFVSVSVFMALSTVFHSINSRDNSPFSRSVLPVLSLSYWFFQVYVSLWKSSSAWI